MLEDYKNALKSGQRAYRACVARGQSPYLAVLDDNAHRGNDPRR